MMFVGIDGGGTTTRIFIQRPPQDEPEYFEFPISLKVRNKDFVASAEKLRRIITQTFARDLATDNSRFKIAIGLSGMGQEEDRNSFRNAILSIPEFSHACLHIESDATLTLRTVLGDGQEGILLIAGTGSVIFYQPSGGAPRRIGGWGPLLSDEGSGYRIGLSALRHYLHVMDGIFPRDALCEAMDARMGAIEITPKSLSARAKTDPTFVASFAQNAFETAENLRHVQDLIHEQLIDLVTLLFPLFVPGVMSGSKPYPLFLSGGVARNKRTIRVIEQAFDDGDVEMHIVDERAPAYKALEIVRSLVCP